MTNIKIEIIKTRLQPPKNRYLHMSFENKVKLNFIYQYRHSGGYTDELGIVSDENGYVREKPAGWRSEIDPQYYFRIREWCEQNLEHGTWYTGIYYIFIEREEDVAWFMLRWS